MRPAHALPYSPNFSLTENEILLVTFCEGVDRQLSRSPAAGPLVRCSSERVYEQHPRRERTAGQPVRSFLLPLCCYHPSVIMTLSDSLCFCMRLGWGDRYASGGGDGPEAVTAALHATLSLNWRPEATKMVVLVADAPPHGIGEYGDGIAGGDPDGHDPLQVVREMAARGITLLCVPPSTQPLFSVLALTFPSARADVNRLVSFLDDLFLFFGKFAVSLPANRPCRATFTASTSSKRSVRPPSLFLSACRVFY